MRLPRSGHRGEVGRVGLHQQTVGRNVARYVPEFAGFREGQDAGEADIAAERDAGLGQRAGGAEAVQEEGEVSPGIAFILQDCRDVVVGVAGMDGQRHAGQPGGADMGAEILLLHVARGAVVEVVQAGFADADDLRVVRHLGQGFRRRDRRFRGVVRMHADGAPEVRVRLGHGRQAGGLRRAWCRW